MIRKFAVKGTLQENVSSCTGLFRYTAQKRKITRQNFFKQYKCDNIQNTKQIIFNRVIFKLRVWGVMGRAKIEQFTSKFQKIDIDSGFEYFAALSA